MIPSDLKRDKVVIDAMAQEWQKKTDAIEAIVPRYDKKGRIDVISNLGGKRPNLYKLYQADVQLKGLVDLENLKTPIIRSDLSDSVMVEAVSLNALRSEQVVQIAKNSNLELEPSVLERIGSKLRGK
jgi:hypothetical protein